MDRRTDIRKTKDYKGIKRIGRTGNITVEIYKQFSWIETIRDIREEKTISKRAV